MPYCEYCGASYQKKVCAECGRLFRACDCDWICNSCADNEERAESDILEPCSCKYCPCGELTEYGAVCSSCLSGAHQG